MKTEKQKIEPSTIAQLREIRENISAETQDMTFEQLQKYIAEHLTDTIHPDVVWIKQSDTKK